ncbi:MAG: ABC transporter ATP-binding protein [Anaerolineales bacterium]|nr:ABC transporter ATP-binding protein [Anaerolineales bacterium]
MGSTRIPALNGVNLQIRPGEFAALMGPSGSGKSTLLHLLGCLDKPTSGAYLLGGRDISKASSDERADMRNRQIGIVFQKFNLLPRISAWENVAMPLLYQGRVKEIQKRAHSALERVGMAHRMNHRPNELSGGEAQRVAIARALIASPTLILADEPTGNLDSKTGQEILQLLTELSREGRTLLLVTHDPQVGAFARRVIQIKDGIIFDDQPNEILTDDID